MTQTRVRVQQKPAPAPSYMPVRGGVLQRKRACGGTPGQPLVPAARTLMEPRFGHDFSKVPVHAPGGEQTELGATTNASDAYAQREQNMTGMPVDVRAKLEQTLGADFSDVRVRYDSSLPAKLGATAFAQGRDIHIAPGNWTPETTHGQEVLGHELAHIMQQRAGRVAATVEMNGIKLNKESALEAEADAIGRLAARSRARPHPTGVETAPQRHPGAYFNATPSQLHAGNVYQLLEKSTTAAPASPWWPITNKTRTVDVDGNDLDFKPGGKIDGPLWHDGNYTIPINTAKSLTMKINLGGNKEQNDDLDVTLSIKDGQATITGSIQGKPSDTYSSAVAGTGTESSPFRLDFTDKQGKKHSIKWEVV